MEIPKFLKEYASYKIKSINSNELMQEREKDNCLHVIHKALSIMENGLITIDEAMEIISNPFVYL